MRFLLKKFLLRIANFFGYRIESVRAARFTVAHVLEAAFEQRGKVVFLQVGAHDGMKNDPVMKLRSRAGWSGLMVEANPGIYPRLQRNVAATPAIRTANVAVSGVSGEVEFSWVKRPEATRCPAWADQISSLSREYVIESLIGWGHDSEEAMALVETKAVPSATFEDLLISFNLRTLDLMLLDVESMDFELLKLFPFHLVKPEWIVFESAHLAEAERVSIPQFLAGHGYSFIEIGEDLVCRAWHTNVR